MQVSRLRAALDAAAARGEKSAGIFLTNGFPDPDATLPLLRAIDEGGADFLELGMPFSDPLAEGLPVQRSSERALRHGVKMRDTLRTAEAFRADSETPIVLMGYVNPIHRYGIRNFCRDARSSGVDGLILPDLPPEESELVEDEVRSAGLDLIYLIAPNTTDERMQAVDAQTSGFVYAVSVTGLTGSSIGATDAVSAYLRRARSNVTRNRLLVGFGIQSREDAVRYSEEIDGFIVGSALINLVERLWDEGLDQEERLSRVKAFIEELKYGRVGASNPV